MPPRRSGNTLKSAQTVPGNQCSRPSKRVFTDPLVLLVFVGVGGDGLCQDGQGPLFRLEVFVFVTGYLFPGSDGAWGNVLFFLFFIFYFLLFSR
jgi:hypothetical protein